MAAEELFGRWCLFGRRGILERAERTSKKPWETGRMRMKSPAYVVFLCFIVSNGAAAQESFYQTRKLHNLTASPSVTLHAFNNENRGQVFFPINFTEKGRKEEISCVSEFIFEKKMKTRDSHFRLFYGVIWCERYPPPSSSPTPFVCGPKKISGVF